MLRNARKSRRQNRQPRCDGLRRFTMLINANRDTSKGDGLDPRVETVEDGGTLVCRFTGNWTTRRVASVDKASRAIPEQGRFSSIVVDLSGIGRLDTAGAWL